MRVRGTPTNFDTDWAALDRRPNILVAAARVEIGEPDLADQVIRQQARIGQPTEFRNLVRLAESLDLPATTVWLAPTVTVGQLHRRTR